MATTRLGLSGFSRGPYGSFTGKEPQKSSTRVTRLGLSGFTRGLYGDFTKEESSVIIPRESTGGYAGTNFIPIADYYMKQALHQDKELIELVVALVEGNLI